MSAACDAPPPPLPVLDPGQRFVALASAALVLGTLLGAVLRGRLAGLPLPLVGFTNLRHAHSHLGYYGVLFPLLWWSWCRGGPRRPGPMVVVVYASAVAMATLGFAREGYGPLAIVSSTVVLLVWLSSAWNAAPQALALRTWWAPAAPSILLSALTIPAVAITSGRGQAALAEQLVQAFLTLLLFGAVLPAALHHRQAPPPIAPLWTLSAVGAGLALGPWPRWPALLALALLGAQLAWAGYRSSGPWDLRALWVGLGLSLVLLGTGLLHNSPAIAVAGLHYAILGPVLVSLGRPLSGRGPRWLCLFYEVLVLLLTATVLLPQWWVGPPWPLLAALLGLLLAALWWLAVGSRLVQARAPR